MTQNNLKIGDIIIGYIRGYPDWPGIIVKKTQKEEKEIKKNKYKIKFFGDPPSIAYIGRSKLNKYCKELINKEQLSKNLDLQLAVEEAESALEFIENDIIQRFPVTVSMNNEFNVNFKVNTAQDKLNNTILLFDLIDYYKNLAIRIYEYCNKIQGKHNYTEKIYYPFPEEDFECLSLSLNVLKEFKFGIDFLSKTKLGILLAFISKNLSPDIKEQNELQRDINNLIKSIKQNVIK